ncbi:DUF1385 domain-containing protein [Coprococcus catus]|uniref:DUF1385 domain-containing protein n=1 Tax=Coprococcus catus TaxID=116085 RepID=UPI001C8BDEC4|nr:DUF1385 domain-containing protein [Coprococcus catus]MBX9229678.1 DUF1385 domain-containing protein [Coprococcus catus]MCT6801450.1 DUF1385 domain-containing protein [Coprococcus catus]
MRYATIGGQAVIEGVMMRNGNDYAVAVRKPDQTIEVKKDQFIGLNAKWHMKKVPIIRGVLAFIDSLVLGMSTLTYSASFYEDEEETEKEKDKDKDGKSDAVFMGLTVALSVVIAVVLFMLTPFFISSLFGKVIKSPMTLAVIEGLIRIAIFFIYIVAISQMKDIQRVFMYHGAEHKTINCIEHGAELTPENAAKYSRLHKRCGTSFLLIVMVVSIICFMFIRVDNMALKIVLRVILVPVIAGVSYEVIQWAGRSESCLVNIVSKPGLMLQKLTTREPDLEMLEVAIASIEAIYDWRQFQAENAAADASRQPGTGSKAGVSQP